MAASTDKRRRSTVNVARLTMWGMEEDTKEGTKYREDPLTWENSLASANYKPKMQTNEQYGDGVKVEAFVAKDGGDIDITVNGFDTGDGEYLFGETNKGGTSVSSADDIVPNVCVAYYTKRTDGKLNLYKFPKTTFYPEGEDGKQQEGTTVSYGTANLKGTYMPLISTGEDSYKRYGVDPNDDTDKEIIEKWFTEADYFGPGTEESAASISTQPDKAEPRNYAVNN